MEENIIWKDIEGFPDYEVSNTGLVYSCKRNHIMKQGNHKGYRRLGLRPGYRQKQKGKLVHDLVLEAFIGPCPEGYEGNHKDCNKANNNIDNLEWVTHKDNMHHAMDNELIPIKGEDNKKSKLTEEKVKNIVDLYATGKYKQQEIGDMFGVSGKRISSIVSRTSWKHLDLNKSESRIGGRGSRNGNSKLTEEIVKEILALAKLGKYSNKKLGPMFGVSRILIGLILNNKIWKHIPRD